MTNVQPVNTTYEPFSREPEYVQANEAFVARQDLTRVERFLDLACGTGTVSELLLAAAPRAHLNGIDLDPVQIDLASRHFEGLGYTVRQGFDLTDERSSDGKPVLVFGVGSADELPFPEATFDCVTISNAIHMMPDIDRFLRAVHRVLKPGGMFGFNSGFYAGSYPAGTERGMFEWVKQASDFIARRNEERKAQGLDPIKRKKGTTRAAFQNRWRTPAEWADELTSRGYAVHDSHERTVMLDERCLAAVGAYGGYAEVLMSGYPVEAASEALQSTAGSSLAALGLEAVPRNWLEIWATRR